MAGHAGVLCGASMRLSISSTGRPVSAETLLRFRMEMDMPGMFIEPMKGALKMRTGIIPRDSASQPLDTHIPRGSEDPRRTDPAG